MARLFDASTELIDVGLIAALNAPSSFWVSAWVYMTALTQDGVIMSNFNGSNGWLFFFDDSNPLGSDRIDFFFGPSANRVGSTAAVPVNTWVHWLGQYDAAALELRLYKNDVLDNTTGGVGSDPGSSAASHIIGHGAAGDGSRPLLGRLAHVRSGLGVLDIGQIKDLVYRGAAGISTEIDMPLWGDSVEVDLSGNGNTGTVTGATVADNPPTALQFGFDEPVPYAVVVAGGFFARRYYDEFLGGNAA